VWQASLTAEVACAAVACAVEASAQEATMAQEGATVFVQKAKAQAILARREAWERVSKVEAESAAALASTSREAEGFARRVALLEGELADAR
jgi:hypothetical protein